MALAIMSTVQHFRLLSFGFETESFCVISDKINCDLVNGSTYSMFLGVPVAWWGTLYYGLLALMSFFAASSRKVRKATVSIAWFMSLAGLPYCAYLAYIAAVVIGAVCIECLGMYAVSVICAIGFFFALKIPVIRAPHFVWNYAKAFFGKTNDLGFKHSVWGHAIVIGLVFGIGWIAMMNYQTGKTAYKKSKFWLNEQLRSHYTQPIYPLEIDPKWPTWGNPGANVKIIEFSEFQCPFCKLASFTIKPYLQEFRNDIAYYFVNFPLDSNCNPDVPNQMHPYACYMARAAICADKKGEFWKFHDVLFRNQSELSRKFALEVAHDKFGWNKSEFAQCIDSSETRERLASQIDAGRKMKLRGTPAVFINGRRIRNWQDKHFLQTLVKEEIKRSR